MQRLIKARWQDWHGTAIEDLTLRETGTTVSVDSIITNNAGVGYTARYTILCDEDWRLRKFEIELKGRGERLALESDGFGTWSNTTGVIPELDAVIDIDIDATPFTNTLPIRRLDLGKNQSQEISVVYVELPELRISVERQIYTCLVRRKCYRFEQPNIGFVREIETDEDGLVLIYPGLFRRI